MRLLRETTLLFWRKVLEALRQPVWVFMGLTTPLLYLALFAPLLRSLAGGPGFRSGDVLDVFVPGILALMAFNAGTGAGWIVIAELDGGVIERLCVTPVSRFALLMGTILRDVLMLIVPALVVIAAAIPFGFHPHWPGVAVLLLLLSLLTAATSAASTALGLILRQIGSLAAVVMGVNLPILLLSGVLLPLSLAPRWMQVIAYANPLYYVVEAARELSSGIVVSWPTAEAFLVMIGLATIILSWATRAYSKAVG